jgi:hypothetical protein
MVRLYDKALYFGPAECAQAALKDISSRRGGNTGGNTESDKSFAKMLTFVYMHARTDSQMRKFFTGEALKTDPNELAKYKADCRFQCGMT